MSLGNGNPKEGDKGSNFNYNLKVLQGLQCICDEVSAINIDTDDIEALLTAIKNSVELIDNCVGTDGATAPPNSFLVAGVTAGGIQQTIEVNASGHVNIADGGGSITVDGGTGVQRTPTFLRPAGLSGTIPAGRYSISFANVGTINATVGGITLKPGETMNFDAGAINNTLSSISYNATGAGGELLIISLT
jgi:hypothetical protein